MSSDKLLLHELQFVVLDEADAMLKVGFQEEIEKILGAIPRLMEST